MIHSELSWKQLTDRLYTERFLTFERSEKDELDAGRLWTEAARRGKPTSRKGLLRALPVCDLEDIEQRVLIKLVDEETLRVAAGSSAPGVYIAQMVRNEALDHVP